MIEELRAHYTRAIGAEPILHEMNTRTGNRYRREGGKHTSCRPFYT